MKSLSLAAALALVAATLLVTRAPAQTTTPRAADPAPAAAAPASSSTAAPARSPVYSDAVLFLDDPEPASLREYVATRPKSPLVGRAHVLLGVAALRDKRYGEAIAAFEQARALLPELGDYLALRLAEALEGEGKHPEAYKLLDELAAKPLESAAKEDVSELLARASFRIGRRDRAAELLSDLLVHTADEPRLVRLLMLQAEWLRAQGDNKEALATYKRVWIYYPHFPESGVARDKARELAALLGVDADLSLDEKLARARELVRLGRDEEAESSLLAVLTQHKAELSPERKAGVLLRRASSAIRRRVPEVAVELCQSLLGSRPVQANRELRIDVLRVLGRALSQLQRYPEAAAVMQQQISELRNPKLKRDAELLYAILIRDSGQPKEAQKLLQAYIDENPRDPKSNDARWFLGWSHYRAGDFATAQKAWQPIVDGSKASSLAPRIWYWLGRAKEDQKRTAEADNYYRRVKAEDPWGYYAWLAEERTRARPALESSPQAQASAASTDGGTNRPRVGEMAVLRLQRGELPTSQKAFERASLLWQLGFLDQAARALRDVPVPEAPSDALLLAQLHEQLQDHFRGFVIAKTRFAKQLRDPMPEQGLDTEHRVALELAYPRAFDRFVAPAAREFNVPEELVYAVMRQESTFKTEAKSWADARGLLQLIPKTAQRIATDIGDTPPSSFVAPDVNIRLGTAYLARLFATFGGQPALAAAAYNAGPFSVDQWLLRLRQSDFDVFVEEIPFRETRDYVKKVAANFAAYRRIYRHERTPVIGMYEPMPQASRGLVDY